ncbi:hypothetical protein TWF696_002457 [Orbilia brochopaga]|uniref:Uncharacterized protein n=1 Tax=Orbilia brochopaga TaxID=3140254 RepID=A0AAV9U7R5_9PEZI
MATTACIQEECLQALAHCSTRMVKTVTPAAVTVTTTCTKGANGSPEKTIEPRAPKDEAAPAGKQAPLTHGHPCGGRENYWKYCGLIGVQAKTVTCTKTPTVTVTAPMKVDITNTNTITRSSMVTVTVSKPAPPPKKSIGFVLRCTNPPKSGENYVEYTTVGQRPAYKLTNSDRQATVFNLDKDGVLRSNKDGLLGTYQNVRGSFLFLNDKTATPITCSRDAKNMINCSSGEHKEFGIYDDNTAKYVFMGQRGCDWKYFNGQQLLFEAVDVYE